MKKTAILLVLCMFTTAAYAGGAGRETWEKSTRREKSAFVNGCMTRIPMMCLQISQLLACEGHGREAVFYEKCIKTSLITKSSVAQVVDEIDKFYQETANKNVLLDAAYDAVEKRLTIDK